jgi:hypothetical protein
MKDDLLMKTPVSAFDGSRFGSSPMSPEPLAKGLAGKSAGVSSRPSAARFAVSGTEESLVVDDRSHLTPAQIVETKLLSRLRESSLPVSHLQMRGLVRARYEA